MKIDYFCVIDFTGYVFIRGTALECSRFIKYTHHKNLSIVTETSNFILKCKITNKVEFEGSYRQCYKKQRKNIHCNIFHKA